MLYVNVERAMMVMSTEDKPLPNVANTADVASPGGREIVEEDEESKALPATQEDSGEIDFSANIDLGVDDFLSSLNKDKDINDNNDELDSEDNLEDKEKPLKAMEKLKNIMKKIKS